MIYQDILETIGRTPVVRLNSIAPNAGAPSSRARP
jgi:hypothetical protein